MYLPQMLSAPAVSRGPCRSARCPQPVGSPLSAVRVHSESPIQLIMYPSRTSDDRRHQFVLHAFVPLLQTRSRAAMEFTTEEPGAIASPRRRAMICGGPRSKLERWLEPKWLRPATTRIRRSLIVGQHCAPRIGYGGARDQRRGHVGDQGGALHGSWVIRWSPCLLVKRW